MASKKNKNGCNITHTVSPTGRNKDLTNNCYLFSNAALLYVQCAVYGNPTADVVGSPFQINFCTAVYRFILQTYVLYNSIFPYNELKWDFMV